eukprot:scaffold117941_cov60-Attheya_sp.AAC.6
MLECQHPSDDYYFQIWAFYGKDDNTTEHDISQHARVLTRLLKSRRTRKEIFLCIITYALSHNKL